MRGAGSYPVARVLRVLHVLPHTGGGGELHVDLLSQIPGSAQQRLYASASRSPVRAIVGLPRRGVAVRRAAMRADLVHVHGDMTAVLMSPFLAGRPWVWTTHGLSFLRRSEGAAHAVFRRRLARVIGSARATVCTTEAERLELLELAGPHHAGRLRVVPNGIAPLAPMAPDRRREVRRALELPPEGVVALFAGRLDDAKGARDAVAAALTARRSGAPLTLLVAGEGPLDEELRAMAGEGVRLLGFRNDVAELLGASDLFVLPSRREGSSYAVIEALAAGLAVVVCDGLGNPETVGDAGVVVACGDVDALAAVLGDLAARPEWRRSLGDAGRARVAGALGVERFMADIEAVYMAAAGPQ